MKTTKYARQISNLNIAFSAILDNKVRAMLTALGIIFGVAAVISMLAIGRGAKQEMLEQIELVGVNNIVVKPVLEQKEEKIETNNDLTKEKNKFSKGLDLLDVKSIQNILPNVKHLSPEIIMETYVINNGIRRSAKLVGIDPNYFPITNIKLEKGKMFSDKQLEKAAPVCIIGKGIKNKFFTSEEALGKYLKCGNQWLKIIGVIEQKSISNKAIENLGIRDYNMDIYTPIKTLLVRYKNRGLINTGGGNTVFFGGGSMMITSKEDDEDPDAKNYHQLDRLVVQVEDSKTISKTAEIVARMLKRKHNEVIDFEISIPEQLLKQQQKTKDIFNFVLGAIAMISLLVGGIGIMNIMLASVLERTREIGVRQALGATKKDVVSQFMFEAILISLTGGLIGVFLGILVSYFITELTEIKTIVTLFSIVLSFGVAAFVGLVFGIAPAKKASEQNPIESLRHE